MRNYTVMFLIFVVASISGGMALKNTFEYSMLFAFGLAIVFLLCAAIAERKMIRNSKRGSDISTVGSWIKAIVIVIVGFGGVWIIMKIPNILGGIALKSTFGYLMLVALGLAIIFLIIEIKNGNSKRNSDISTIRSWIKAIAILVVGFGGAWIIMKIPNLF